MTYEEWKATAVGYTPDEVPSYASHVFDVHPTFVEVFVFEDGSYFINTGNSFHCHVCCSEIETVDYETAAKFLWDEWSSSNVED